MGGYCFIVFSTLAIAVSIATWLILKGPRDKQSATAMLAIGAVLAFLAVNDWAFTCWMFGWCAPPYHDAIGLIAGPSLGFIAYGLRGLLDSQSPPR